jgi:hypothetical protein
VELTVAVTPLGAGTTIPVPGTREVALDTVVALKATPNAGFRFTNWSENVTNPGQPSTTVFMDAAETVTANFVSCVCATDISGAIGVTPGAITLSRSTKRYVQSVTLKNNSAARITAPISLVLDNLTPGVTLANAKGQTILMLPADSPYINANASLAPGQSVTVQLQFTNPDNIDFSYDSRVLAGPGSR